jgi:hypothetical protein
MDIVLLKNGFGLVKSETIQIKSGMLQLRFVDAPEGSVVTIIGDHGRMARFLEADSTYNLDLSNITGEIKIILSGNGKVWSCEGIYVSRDVDGEITVHTLPDVVKQISYCVDKIAGLEKSLEYINGQIAEMRERINMTIKQYELV